MNIVKISFEFSGIYENGTGWLSEVQQDKWQEFLRLINEKSVFWKYFNYYHSLSNRSDYLVSVGGSMYLHPMLCNTVYMVHGHDITDNNSVFHDSTTDELIRIMCDLAKYCGGTVKVNYGKAIDDFSATNKMLDITDVLNHMISIKCLIS